MPNDTTPTTDNPIRETYQEYMVGETSVAMIADPRNERAWIQSTTTADIEP